MGAAASADFYTRVVSIAQKTYHAEEDDDFPAMWIYNLPVTGFNETGFLDPESVKSQMIAAIQNLAKAGSDFIVIPCNTAHHFYKEMQASVQVPILSILEVTAKAVKDAGFSKVGLLNSQSTKQFHLYEDIFAKNNIGTLSTTDAEQQQVTQVIGHVISGTQGANEIESLNNIAKRYAQAGAQAVILGCTELPLAFSEKDCSLPLFDTTGLLAEAALKYSYNI